MYSHSSVVPTLFVVHYTRMAMLYRTHIQRCYRALKAIVLIQRMPIHWDPLQGLLALRTSLDAPMSNY